MNSHERDRVADAMNRLRPDWPVKQLRTLLDHRSLTDRPRRDVTVALAWVACESASHTPYRVLESGPWWRAVAVDGADSRPLNRGPWCGVCGASKSGHPDGDHAFEGPADRKRSPEAMRAIVEEAKGRLESTRTPEPPPEPVHDPRAADARAALHPEPQRDVRAIARALIHPLTRPKRNADPVAEYHEHHRYGDVDHERVRAAMHRFRPGQPLTWPTTTTERNPA